MTPLERALKRAAAQLINDVRQRFLRESIVRLSGLSCRVLLFYFHDAPLSFCARL